MIPPEQRVNSAMSLFFPALATLRAMLPPDAYNQVIQEALNQLESGFADLKKASDDYKDGYEVFEMLYNYEMANEKELQEECTVLLVQNKRLERAIEATADHLYCPWGRTAVLS